MAPLVVHEKSFLEVHHQSRMDPGASVTWKEQPAAEERTRMAKLLLIHCIQRFSKVTHWLFRDVGGYDPLNPESLGDPSHSGQKSCTAYAVAVETGHGLIAKGIVVL